MVVFVCLLGAGCSLLSWNLLLYPRVVIEELNIQLEIKQSEIANLNKKVDDDVHMVQDETAHLAAHGVLQVQHWVHNFAFDFPRGNPKQRESCSLTPKSPVDSQAGLLAETAHAAAGGGRAEEPAVQQQSP